MPALAAVRRHGGKAFGSEGSQESHRGILPPRPPIVSDRIYPNEKRIAGDSDPDRGLRAVGGPDLSVGRRPADDRTRPRERRPAARPGDLPASLRDRSEGRTPSPARPREPPRHVRQWRADRRTFPGARRPGYDRRLAVPRPDPRRHAGGGERGRPVGGRPLVGGDHDPPGLGAVRFPADRVGAARRGAGRPRPPGPAADRQRAPRAPRHGAARPPPARAGPGDHPCRTGRPPPPRSDGRVPRRLPRSTARAGPSPSQAPAR